VLRRVLPALRAAGPDDAVPYAVFGAGFESPPGFRLQAWRFLLGDMALRLVSPRANSALVLRQVYPAQLALARRPLARWLTERVFAEHRVFRPLGDLESAMLEAQGRELPGIRQKGRKTLPFPLGAVSALESVHAAVHDPEVDRIFLAGHDARYPLREEVVRRALAGMSVTGGQRGELR
jgi:hypothetical protein